MSENFCISLHRLSLPLKFTWKISRNASEAKTNFLVGIRQLQASGFGEVAFNVRYGESEELIQEKFDQVLPPIEEFLVRQSSDSAPLTQLQNFSRFLETLELPCSLRFGFESAMAHFLASREERPVWQLLQLVEPRPVATSFSLPILEVGEIAEFIQTHQLNRFSYLKIKVDERATERVREVSKHFRGRLRVDANEAWREVDEVLRFQESVKDLPIQFIEQPLPADLMEACRELKKHRRIPLMADEALTSGGVFSEHIECYDMVNVKLMKAGGYLQAIQQLNQARELGLGTMLGCMVETSVGIASALNLSEGVDLFDLDGSLLLAKEPYSWISENQGSLQLTTRAFSGVESFTD